MCATVWLGFVMAAASGDLFALEGRDNIVEEAHFGIVNGLATIGVNYKDIGSVAGLWAPPYVSSDFAVTVKVSGKPIATDTYTWLPFEVQRRGKIESIEADTATMLCPGMRGGMIAVELKNAASDAKTLSIELGISGTLDRVVNWEFQRAESHSSTTASFNGSVVTLSQGDIAIAVGTNLDGSSWNADGKRWQGEISLPASETRTWYVAFAIGPEPEAVAACAKALAAPGATLEAARAEYQRHVDDLFAKLPAFDSDNASLVRLYNRSLVHLIMNRWDVPEFVLHPYYSTGSVKGGCVCNYLWNFGETWELLPLYDPAAMREHIKQFLKTDLVEHFAFMPVTGEAFGPWYMVNQEKIIGLIYYYVKNTGDTAFLRDTVAGKTILDWVVFHATVKDDTSKPVALIDYGPSNSHLELRRGYPYNHVMPDLNGRRYMNYRMAAALCDIADRPEPNLLERASALKALLKQELWDSEAQWFWFEDDKGAKDLRYTVQLYKLFGSGVLDPDEEMGLLAHLNETEFLSEQGLHSMSKTDIAYDQVDIDNGGGGICTSFTPQIAERLYKSNHAGRADDILRRILWWGERMPYWGDSLVANSIDYRKDTPLQCTLDGIAVAQCIIFGMFGVDAGLDGVVTINPHLPPYATRIALKGLKLRGKTFDIEVSGARYSVSVDGMTHGQPLGKPFMFK